MFSLIFNLYVLRVWSLDRNNILVFLYSYDNFHVSTSMWHSSHGQVQVCVFFLYVLLYFFIICELFISNLDLRVCLFHLWYMFIEHMKIIHI